MNADKRFFRLRFRNSCGVHQEGDLLQIAQTIMPSLHRTFGYGVKIILIRENPSRSVFIRVRIHVRLRFDPQTSTAALTNFGGQVRRINADKSC